MTSLAKQFANHTIERAYHAVVWGAPRAAEGVIEGQIGRSPFDRKRMAVLRGGGKLARTRYRVLERFGPDGAAAGLPDRMPAGNRPHPSDPRPPHPSGPSPDRRSAPMAAPARRRGPKPQRRKWHLRPPPTFPARRCMPLSWGSSIPACTRPCVSSPPGPPISRAWSEALRGLKDQLTELPFPSFQGCVPGA